jgi:hypothetical protein
VFSIGGYRANDFDRNRVELLRALENIYRQSPDTTSWATPTNLEPHTGIHANPVLGKPTTSVFSLLTAFGFISE